MNWDLTLTMMIARRPITISETGVLYADLRSLKSAKLTQKPTKTNLKLVSRRVHITTEPGLDTHHDHRKKAYNDQRDRRLVRRLETAQVRKAQDVHVRRCEYAREVCEVRARAMESPVESATRALEPLGGFVEKTRLGWVGESARGFR